MKFKWIPLTGSNVANYAPNEGGYYAIRNSGNKNVVFAADNPNVRDALKQRLAGNGRVDECIRAHGGDEFMALTAEEIRQIRREQVGPGVRPPCR
ncbi:MAG: hypothetical protein OXH99_10610 [Bryobacterales bacterium]|nr:hypothetical protein [Bryobacterales bacterium]